MNFRVLAQIPDKGFESVDNIVNRFGWEAGALVVIMIFTLFFGRRGFITLYTLLEEHLKNTADSDMRTAEAVEKLAVIMPTQQMRIETIDDRITRVIKSLREAAHVAHALVPEDRKELKTKLFNVIEELD